VAGARVAIQGFGQVGAVAAEQCQQADCRVVAVSDSRSAVTNPDGLDVVALRAHKAETGGVADFPGGEPLDPAALLAVDCDVLIPAAVQGVIHEGNAGDVRARLLVEAANAPTTMAAHAMLAERGVTIVPDVLANAGSVQLCQMERTQGLYDNYWDADTIDRLRHERMVEAYRAARSTAAHCNTESMRLGAWINALRQIEEASRARGWC
jgi:glutamate dehydrogenase/leucine dehydrogenase